MLKAVLGLSLDKWVIWDQSTNSPFNLTQTKMDHIKMDLMEKSGLVFVQPKGVPLGPSKGNAYS